MTSEGSNITQMANPCRKCGSEIGKSVHNLCVLCSWKPRVAEGDGGHHVYVKHRYDDGETYVGLLRYPPFPHEIPPFWERVRTFLQQEHGYAATSES